jgi:hypothetical protein
MPVNIPTPPASNFVTYNQWVTIASAVDSRLIALNSSAGRPGSPHSEVVYAAAGDSVKVTVDGVDADGKPTHNEWTGKFDGKDYPLTGDPTSDSRAYTRVNDHTLSLTANKGGKVTLTGRIFVAADGKSRTITTCGTDAQGKKYSSTAVYDKQ